VASGRAPAASAFRRRIGEPRGNEPLVFQAIESRILGPERHRLGRRELFTFKLKSSRPKRSSVGNDIDHVGDAQTDCYRLHRLTRNARPRACLKREELPNQISR